jgi:predicted Zn-dependent peptidase
MNYTHKVLDNDLNVFFVHVPEAESVVFTIYAQVGSRYENANNHGIAHYLEHVFFKGSRNYPYPHSLTSLVDSIGGDFNASTSKESTEFYIRASKEHFDLIFDVLTDMLLNPLFKEEELEKEKGVVIEEIKMYEDKPGHQAARILENLMWPDSFLGRNIVGSEESIRAMNRKKVFEFRDKFYQPKNMVLGVGGSFDQQLALKKIKSTWANLENKKVGTFKPVSNKQSSPNLQLEYKKTNQAHLALGFKSFEHDSKKNPAAYLLAGILGGSMSSRLFLNIREQKGWAYYISASNNPYYNTGNFIINAGIKIANCKEAVTEILSELRKIKSEIIIDTELKKAKDYVKGRVALGLEDNHQKLDWILDSFCYHKRVLTAQDFFKEIDEVTSQDLHDVANEIFTNERMSLAIVGPFKNKKEFTKELVIKENF